MGREYSETDFRKKARALLHEKKYDELHRLCRAALQYESRPKGVWFYLGRCLMETGQLKEAIGAFRNQLVLDKRQPVELLSALGVLLRDTGNPARSAMVYRIACEKEPEAHVWVLYGVVLCDLGLKQEARKAFETAIECDPEFDEAFYNLGISWEDENPDKAWALFERALELDPAYTSSYERLSILSYDREDYEQAAEFARKGLAVNSDCPRCRLRLALALEVLGDLRAAEGEYRKVADGDYYSLSARLHLADLLRGQGRYDEAHREYHSILRAWPDEERAYVSYIRFLEESLHRKDDADRVREELAELTQLLDCQRQS